MAASQKKEAATSSISMAAGADAASSLLSSSSNDNNKDKDKKKRNYSSMAATDDHQPLKRPKTPSSTPSPSTAWGRLGVQLPYDILILILQNLLLQDHLRLSCVSIPWNLAVRGGGGGLGHDDHPSSPMPQLPWLMISGAGRHHTSAKFICLSEHRTYDIPLPHPPIRERICIGSTHGWLITLHNFSEMHLLNPITRIQVSLPAITSTTTSATTYPSGYIRTGPPTWYSPFFGKAILSSAPAKDGTGDFTIFLIRQMPTSSCRTLSIARIGDPAWTTFANEHFLDIIYHKGQLHCMGMKGYIHIWEHQQHDHHLDIVPRFTIDTKKIHHNNIPLELTYTEIIGSRNHLVQSTTGELFMLIRTQNVTSNGLSRFQIARLDLDRNEYIPVDDTKDLVFFVGINDSIIVSATKFPEVKRNCVYFTKHYAVVRQSLRKLNKNISPPLDSSSVPTCSKIIGVFDVEKKEQAELLDIIGSHLSWKEKKHFGSLFNWCSPTWITPTLF